MCDQINIFHKKTLVQVRATQKLHDRAALTVVNGPVAKHCD